MLPFVYSGDNDDREKEDSLGGGVHEATRTQVRAHAHVHALIRGIGRLARDRHAEAEVIILSRSVKGAVVVGRDQVPRNVSATTEIEAVHLIAIAIEAVEVVATLSDVQIALALEFSVAIVRVFGLDRDRGEFSSALPYLSSLNTRSDSTSGHAYGQPHYKIVLKVLPSDIQREGGSLTRIRPQLLHYLPTRCICFWLQQVKASTKPFVNSIDLQLFLGISSLTR
ncbi:unnamed protein product [Toxocara canis]|uniref:Uncharacterized protein n=1 Tax=Toxocara canis TaxID=6265 RepID=A0A183UST3_TOXCA|nr:unnamed protein product [Toxocara canis]